MRRSLWLLAVALLLGGCSGIKLAYNNLDRLVRWGVSDYVDLNDAQKAYLQTEFAAVHQWHRTYHLPQYAQFMRELAVEMRETVSPDQLQAIFTQVFVWADEVEEKTMPLVLHMLRSLTAAQVAALPEQLEKSNLEVAKSELGVDLAKAQSEWAEEIEDGLKMFAGRLEGAQRDYIRRRASGYRPERVLWADYRRRFQADLLALLERRDKGAGFERDYRALVASREAYYGPELTEVFDHNLALGREIAAHVLSNLNDRQSERFSSKMLEISDDLMELSAQGAAG